jgi:hypothetical protein
MPGPRHLVEKQEHHDPQGHLSPPGSSHEEKKAVNDVTDQSNVEDVEKGKMIDSQEFED